MLQESIDGANEVVALLAKRGLDYSAQRDRIAEELFENGVFEGNWDSSVDFPDTDLRALRIIQEDEYEQHMDEDEDRPAQEDSLGYAEAGYIWFA